MVAPDSSPDNIGEWSEMECVYCNEEIPVYISQELQVVHSVCTSKTGEDQFTQFQCLRFFCLDYKAIREYNRKCPHIPYMMDKRDRIRGVGDRN